MPEPAADERPCRTCGRPRGVNVAEGTRCARCGRRHAFIVWILAVFAAGEWTWFSGAPLADAWTVAVVTLVTFVPALVGVVLLHELSHAAVGRLLGQTVTRVLVGEGRSAVRVGRDPELVFGSVVVGNGLTTVMDLRLDRYRGRMSAMLLTAPMVSLAVGVGVWIASAAWSLPPRAAARVFALGNLALAIVTLVPVPTFGGRVWSDLAVARHLWRAADAELVEQMLLSVRDRLAILLERGDVDAAIATARQAVAVAPQAALAQSLLAFTLLQVGRREEAARVARSVMAGAIDDRDRDYLARLVEEAERGTAGE